MNVLTTGEFLAFASIQAHDCVYLVGLLIMGDSFYLYRSVRSAMGANASTRNSAQIEDTPAARAFRAASNGQSTINVEQFEVSSVSLVLISL